MAIKQIIENIIFSRITLKYSLLEIERSLSVKIIKIKRIKKIYHLKANSFIVRTISAENKGATYFLKFSKKEDIKKEVEGNQFLKKSLPVPKIVLVSRVFSWILFEYIPGQLMAEKFLKVKSEKELELFCKIEKRKEKLLNILYSAPKIRINFDDYIKSRANKLFSERLFGERYKLFFAKNSKNISSYFDRKFIINNKEFPYSINQIIDLIRKKYYLRNDKKIVAIMGQGDAHHGNIIVNKKIWFIDNEYADFIPPLMELAKPYYNDFIGTLFFHHHKILNRYFQIDHFKDTGNKLVFRIRCPQKINNFLKITKIKIQEKRTLANRKTSDFLSLNDYLILCHILTRNPNRYPLKTRMLFLMFVIILAEFDPFNPDSIYDPLQ